MTPHARTLFALVGLPVLNVDCTRAPAVFDHESGWRPAIKRCDEVAGVPAERDRNAIFLGKGKVVALTDIVKAEQLHHDVMDRVLAALNESETVMARIDVEKSRHERFGIVVRKPKPKRFVVEIHQPIERVLVVDVEYDVAETQRAGAKSGNATPGPEWLGGSFGAVEDFEPIADRVGDRHEIGHP